MAKSSRSKIAGIVAKHESDLASEWIKELQGASGRDHRISDAQLRNQVAEFISLLKTAAETGDLADTSRSEWSEMRNFLHESSRSRVLQGFAADETAKFIFAFKKPLISKLKKELGSDAESLAEETWIATALIDELGMLTIKSFQETREDVINRQQQELLELSTPVVKLWDGILALPMIGTLDSNRTQIVMESLLQRIVETGAELAIIDITGVPTVDTQVAQHLLKTVTAIRLMGADCIISGVRPQIAQTIVHLGVDLQGVTTKSNLADALNLGLRKLGFVVTRKSAN